MDGRGFAEPGCRTLARPRPITRGDLTVIAVSAVIAFLASATSVASGSWRFFLRP